MKFREVFLSLFSVSRPAGDQSAAGNGAWNGGKVPQTLARDIRLGQPWSAFALKHHFAWEVSAQQLKRAAQQEARREIKLRLAA